MKKEDYMEPVKREPLQPSKQAQEGAPKQKISDALKTTKSAAENYVIKGAGSRLLGAGKPPTISDKAPVTVSARVSKATGPLLPHPKTSR